MPEKIYMGGVCGMGMAPLAAFMKLDGLDVSGFDDAPNPDTRKMLEEFGVAIRRAPAGERFDRIVISSALRPRAGELAAEYPGAKVELRGQAWAKICASRRLVAVVGSHGKSTVSAMAAQAAALGGENFGWLIGACPRGFPMLGHCEAGGVLISEIDESDATIELFSPEVCVALNSDLDHVDTYADKPEMLKMFERLFSRTGRAVVYPESDAELKGLAAASGLEAYPVKVSDDFTKTNANFARAACEAAFGKTFSAEAFGAFKGLARRQEVLADFPGFFAVSDYAHHPRELDSFLTWIHKRRPGKITVIFQPHRYTRTKRFAAEFAEILDACARRGNEVILLPVYPASEPFDPEGESRKISEKSANIKLARKKDACDAILRAAEERSGASFAIVGAGDFHFEAKSLIESIKFQRKDTTT